MWWSVILLCVSVSCQTVKYAEKRVINGVDYVYHHQHQQQQALEQSLGLSAYSNYGPKMPETQEQHKNVRTVVVTKKVPVPYPVQVEKKVPVPVKVPIRRPYTVYVPKPYYVEVMKQVPVPVKVPIPQPYTVEKHVPFPYKVHYDKPYPVHITKPYPVYYEKRVPIHMEKPVALPYKVHVDRPVPVSVPMERPMYFPVERPYPFPVKVPVDKPIPTHKQVPVPVTMDKPHLAAEQSALSNYYTSTQPSVHNTFSPSPYDELTSTMLTEGKHKVISFLPGSGNSFGSYGSSSADIGTIHVSNIKSNGGNSTDWVPKAIPNSQYLTYIPNTHPKYLQYTLPQKETKPQEVNAEQYVVKHGSVKMHYKLHYDPVKQEYSFQLVPKTQAQQTGPSYQALTGENSQKPAQTEYVYKTPDSSQHPKSTQTEYVYHTPDGSQYPKSTETDYVYKTPDGSQYPKSTQTEYVYKTPDGSHYPKSTQTEYIYKTSDSNLYPKSTQTDNVHKTSDGSEYPKSTQTDYVYKTPDGSEYPKSTQTEYVYKTEDGQTYQFSSKPINGLTYSYQQHAKPEVNTAQQNSDSAVSYYPGGDQQLQYKPEEPYPFQAVDSPSQGQIPQVTYSYQPAVQTKPETQNGPPQVTYTFHTDNNGKFSFDPQYKSSGYPAEHVSYIYVPRSSQEATNAEAQFTIPEQTQISTEYPQILYQQGRISTIMRENYVTPTPAEEGKIPENFKSSRTSESLVSPNDTHSSRSGDTKDNEVLKASTSDNYPKNSRRSRYNLTNEDAPSSIRFEKFGVADVMSSVRTKLYPVNDSSEQQQLRPQDTSETSSTSSYDLGLPLEQYFQENESSTPGDITEIPFNAKVYRLSSYKVPRSRRVTRTKRKKTTESPSESQENTTRYNERDDEEMTTAVSVNWYRFFDPDESQRHHNVVKGTNSHTGADDRPFRGIMTSTSTTTTSNSLQPPDDSITAKPTQSLRTRSRGSVKAYGKRKEESTTEGNSTTTATTRTRRRRRPARRRMDQAMESTTEESQM